MEFKPIHINAFDIPDAWFQCIYNVIKYGNKYEIQQGSYVGQTRLEFDWISVFIKNPYKTVTKIDKKGNSYESYDAMLPKMPEGSTIVPPVEDGYIEQYMPYLMTGKVDPGEQYTYGSRINEYRDIKERNGRLEFRLINQIEHWIEVLKETPNTNQAILQVGEPSDCKLTDPPCLRSIDLKIKEGKLIFYPYFRSWDLWGGFPANLAGIAVLQKYMSEMIGIESGPILCSSKGLHLYGYVEELGKILKGDF